MDAWRTPGIWSHKLEYVPCNKKIDEACSKWVFNTADGKPVIDESPIVEVQMGEVSRIGLRVGGAVALVVILGFWIVMELCKDTRLIKATQPNMMKIVLVGGALACIRVLLATVDITDAQCVAGKWLAHMSFALVFGALIIKTWRVDAVVNSGFRKVRVTGDQVQRVLGACLLMFCLYLFGDTMYGEPHRSYEESFDGRSRIRLIKCENKRQTMAIVLFAVEAAMLVGGAKLCWSTKDVPSAINDSRYIAMSMYLILFVSSVTFPIVFFQIQPVPATLLMIMAVGFVVATVGCVVLLFGAKTLLLLEGADVDANFLIVKQDENGRAISNGLLVVKDRIKSRISSRSAGKVSQTQQTREKPSSRGASEVHMHNFVRD
eukprot:gene36731-47884_t